jgi:hypothetical protein
MIQKNRTGLDKARHRSGPTPDRHGHDSIGVSGCPVCPVKSQLASITTAASELVPIGGLPTAAGLTPEQWQALLQDHPDDVALAVAQGRALAQVRINLALQQAASYGKAEAALFILQRSHGWPRPRLGRPPKASVQAALLAVVQPWASP